METEDMVVNCRPKKKIIIKLGHPSWAVENLFEECHTLK